jgi:hypothetical protein
VYIRLLANIERLMARDSQVGVARSLQPAATASEILLLYLWRGLQAYSCVSGQYRTSTLSGR